MKISKCIFIWLKIESDAYSHSPKAIIYRNHGKFMSVFYFHFQSNILQTSSYEDAFSKSRIHFASHFRLEELRIDQNLLANLPNNLKLLRNLKSLQVADNKISKLPDFMTAMRFNNGVVS